MQLSDNLVAYYKLDETSGNRSDSSGNSKTLTDNGSVGYASGVYSNAAHFTGSLGKYLKNSTAIGSGANVSYSFWLKSNNPNPGNAYRYLLHYLDDYLYTDIKVQNGLTLSVGVGAGLNTTTATLNSGAWNYITVTIQGSTVKVYINADLKNTWTMSPADPGANSLTIGSESSSVANGDVDEFGIWDRVLSQTEITRLYNSGNGYTHPLPYDYSLTSDQQSYLLTGLDIFLAVSGKIQTETGNFNLTWGDVGVHYNRFFQTQTQSYLLTGIDANVRKSRWNLPSKNMTTFTYPSKK